MIYGVIDRPVYSQKYDISNNKAEAFDNVLQSQECGYSRFVTQLKRQYAESFSGSYFNEIDISKVPLWTRKDFPKYLTFDENCTQDILNKVKMPYEEPAYGFDPKVQDVWGDIAGENCVSFIVHPKAAEKMDSDPAFYKKVMENVKKAVPFNVRENVAADFKEMGSTLIDLSVFITIDENGGVNYNGYCSGVQEIRPEEEQDTQEQDDREYDNYDKTYRHFDTTDNAVLDFTSDENTAVLNNYFEIYNSNLAYSAADYGYRKKQNLW